MKLGLNLRLGPSTLFAVHVLLTDTIVRFEVVGQSNTTPVWYQIQFDASFRGWVHGDYVTLSKSRFLKTCQKKCPQYRFEEKAGNANSQQAVSTLVTCPLSGEGQLPGLLEVRAG